MMGEMVAKLFLGHYTFSSFNPHKMDVKECILASFKVQEDDVKTKEAFF
jgi:hypothetical protein